MKCNRLSLSLTAKNYFVIVIADAIQIYKKGLALKAVIFR